MKKYIIICLSIVMFITLGCSTSKEVISHKNEKDINYHINAKAHGDDENDILAKSQFRGLEDLGSRFANIHVNKREQREYECEVEVLFNALTIKDKEYGKNRHFSKEVQGEQTQSQDDDGPTTNTETVRGYVYQRIKERKLEWGIEIRIKSDTESCKLRDTSFTEKLASKSIDNLFTGDERAIPAKYREPIGVPLRNEEDMKEEAIHRVFKKVQDIIRSNQ